MTEPTPAELLRAPFEPHQIGSLPRGGTTLDYVGHAAVTDRLLSVDPVWNWEPFATTEHGAPLVLHESGRRTLWIRLTVCGVTRIGVGIVKGDKDEVEKELIGDAIRNAAMRFGVALDLWHKGGSLNGDGTAEEENPGRAPAADPKDWWKDNGWQDEADHNAHKAKTKEAAAALSDEGKETLKAWWEAVGYGGTMTHAEWAEYAGQVSALAAGETDGSEPF